MKLKYRIILLVIMIFCKLQLIGQESPVSLNNLQIWLSSDSISEAGSTADTIFDKSGNQNHAFFIFGY